MGGKLMNPYERTADEMKRQSEGPKRFAKTAVGVGASVAGPSSFASILSRAAPFLSQYIPEDLAIKGLSKISPKFGKFVNDAINGGYDFNQVKDFIGQQVEQSQESAKQNKNPIQQYSPDLHNFMLEQIKSGRPSLEAGALARTKFEKEIKKLEKDHKTSWSSLIESVYGSEKTKKSALEKFNQKRGFMQEERDRFNQGYGQQAQGQQGQVYYDQPQQGQQQQGQGQQAMMAILQRINQRLGQ